MPQKTAPKKLTIIYWVLLLLLSLTNYHSMTQDEFQTLILPVLLVILACQLVQIFMKKWPGFLAVAGLIHWLGLLWIFIWFGFSGMSFA